MAADLKLLVAGFLRGRHLRRFIERQPGGLLDLMQADVGQGGLGVPSYKFFQVLLAVTSHTRLYVGATGNMEGTGCVCGCGCGSYATHEDNCCYFQQELNIFYQAVSGADRILYHSLHWYDLTRVLNNSDVLQTSPAFRYYRFILDSPGLIAVTDKPIMFKLPYPLEASLIYPGASQGGWQQRFEPRRDQEMGANRNSFVLRDRAGRGRDRTKTAPFGPWAMRCSSFLFPPSWPSRQRWGITTW